MQLVKNYLISKAFVMETLLQLVEERGDEIGHDGGLRLFVKG